MPLEVWRNWSLVRFLRRREREVTGSIELSRFGIICENMESPPSYTEVIVNLIEHGIKSRLDSIILSHCPSLNCLTNSRKKVAGNSCLVSERAPFVFAIVTTSSLLVISYRYSDIF